MRALLAFGSKYGSTSKVVAEMATVLGHDGVEVTIADLRKDKVKGLEAYDLIVVGSSIIMGQWTKPARRFLEENSAVLSRKRVAMFACCIDVVCFPSKIQELSKRYLDDVAASYGIGRPTSTALFAGEIDLSKYGFLDATMAKAYMKNDKVEAKEKLVDLSKPLDFHDWDGIRRWAASLDLKVQGQVF